MTDSALAVRNISLTKKNKNATTAESSRDTKSLQCLFLEMINLYPFISHFVILLAVSLTLFNKIYFL